MNLEVRFMSDSKSFQPLQIKNKNWTKLDRVYVRFMIAKLSAKTLSNRALLRKHLFQKKTEAQMY